MCISEKTQKTNKVINKLAKIKIKRVYGRQPGVIFTKAASYNFESLESFYFRHSQTAMHNPQNFMS